MNPTTDRNPPASPRGPAPGTDRTAEANERQEKRLREQTSSIRHKIVVLSGKGGVGKSTVAANLAVTLQRHGRKTGLLDIDIHGPSIPAMVGIQGQAVHGRNESIQPIDVNGLKVMSMGLLLPSRDDAVIWRGPMKYHVIRQFLSDVEWGTLDVLVVDSPPGTGDEPLSVVQLLGELDGSVIVTTPQDVAISDVRKCVTFCRKLELPILGVVENMSGLICPHCGKNVNVFKSGGGERMAADMGLPFLGRIPLDPGVTETADAGKPYVEAFADSPTAQAFEKTVQPLIELTS